MGEKFNWSEVHFFGSISYEIHILVMFENLQSFSLITYVCLLESLNFKDAYFENKRMRFSANRMIDIKKKISM